MRYDNNLRVVVKIIHEYKGTTPLSSWLKEYFRNNKQMGSSDRRIITSLLYSYFRLGNALKHVPPAEKILIALFLTNTASTPFLQHMKPEWDLNVWKDIDSKLLLLKQQEGVDIAGKIFPYTSALSEGVEPSKFEHSFLTQPDLFIRVRPGKKEEVLHKLQKEGINFKELADNCISMPNATKTNDIFIADAEAVVQDYNSQRTGLYLNRLQQETRKLNVWDCCAASGGKSIMAFDILSEIQLTVSDKRSIILENLQQRFTKAGITRYHSFIADLSKPNPLQGSPSFDLIICDAPCTGSGTWSRSPEQLFFFKPQNIDTYCLLQKQIIENVLPYLVPGGMLLYITCSVFKKENEDVVTYLTDYLQLKLIESSILKGYDMRADTMYAALLSKPM